jgi:hypothetical protein
VNNFEIIAAERMRIVDARNKNEAGSAKRAKLRQRREGLVASQNLELTIVDLFLAETETRASIVGKRTVSSVAALFVMRRF